MTEPVQLAVVGHTNAGKTSLLRTLTRQPDFGEVSDRPGTTRHVEARDLKVNGTAAIRLFDTPGLEDSIALHAFLQQQQGHSSPADRVRAFLQQPEAKGVFEQEAKVLRKVMEAHAAIYVIDARDPVLPKHRAEIEILTGCARPVLPVLNFAADPRSRVEAWSAALRDHNLHAQVVFDVIAPKVGSEELLYQSLAMVVPASKETLAALLDDLQVQRLARRQAGCRVIADTLVKTAALRMEITPDDYLDPAKRQVRVEEMHGRTRECVREGLRSLLMVYGFDKDEVDDALVPWTEGRWESDLFNPEVLRDASFKLGTGAAVGAAIGVAADLALAGLSLGAGAALGATIGGAVSQGWSRLGRQLVNKARRIQELSVDNEVLYVECAHLLAVMTTLERRGHAASGKISVKDASAAAREPLRNVALALGPARGYEAWANPQTCSGAELARRDRLVEMVATKVGEAAAMVDQA